MFFKKKENKLEDNYLIKIASLLIHAAKIDEHFTKEEEVIIKDTLIQLGSSVDSIDQLIEKAKSMEENSNQILDFTREVKNLEESEEIKIVEALWRIIYSNKDADMYETNLMRRLAGLLYIDNQAMGDIKEKIKKEKSS